MIDSNSPEPIRPAKDPDLGRPYLLYRPTAYDRNKDWPLIVVCSSSFPDSPARRIREWTNLAESRGFLVLAPTIEADTGTIAPKAAKHIPLLRDDERHMLAALQHVRAGHSVSDDRIFMHAYGGGVVSALYTCLRHPELFRAIDVSDPKFHSTGLGDVADRIDPFQPVQIHYRITDKLLGKHGKNCEDWLRSNGAKLRGDVPGPSKPGDAELAVGFFEVVMRSEPWMRIETQAPDTRKPREIRFMLKGSFTPAQFAWNFGDGQTSPLAEPSHAYAQPGTYRVDLTVSAAGPKGASHRRFKDVTVP